MTTTKFPAIGGTVHYQGEPHEVTWIGHSTGNHTPVVEIRPNGRRTGYTQTVRLADLDAEVALVRATGRHVPAHRIAQQLSIILSDAYLTYVLTPGATRPHIPT